MIPRASSAEPDAVRSTHVPYPVPPTSDVVDDYFGTPVPDPFRPLEAIDAPETRAWVAKQAERTEAFLAANPARGPLRDRLRAIWNYERVGLPQHEGETYLIARNTGLQNQPVLYVARGEHGERRVLIDPNALSADGTVALASGVLSRDGTLLAYATQTAGSDWLTWRVREVATGNDRPDRVEWSKFSTADWAIDGSGFYYAGYDPPANPDDLNIVNAHQKLFFHHLGTPQHADRLVYERPDHPEWYLGAGVTDDGAYLLYVTSNGAKNGLLYRDLTNDAVEPIELFAGERAQYTFVANDGPRFFILTNDGAARGKLIAIDVRSGATETIVPEGSDAIETVSSVGDRLFVTYLTDAHARVVLFDHDGTRVRELALPGIGSVAGFSGRRDDRVTYYAFSNYTTPSTIYRYDVATDASVVYHAPRATFDASAFASEQVFCTSLDGTRIPMFISYRRDTPKDGSAPAILYGYGGFDVSLVPAFSAAVAAWVELGGVYAVANLRGGGEYGAAWHEAGMLERKQNVFDDFASAARYLVANGYASPAKLALKGDSNGGLLCAATVTQHPELAGAVVCGVGVTDMLRFATFTVGAAWIPEYGSPHADAAQFATLYAYSPLHNLTPGTAYPAMLISTGDHDDRVFPAHSFKFAAAAQAAQGGDAPILLHVAAKAGHGAGKPLDKTIDEIADQYAFLTNVFGYDPPSNASSGTGPFSR